MSTTNNQYTSNELDENTGLIDKLLNENYLDIIENGDNVNIKNDEIRNIISYSKTSKYLSCYNYCLIYLLVVWITFILTFITILILR